MKRRMARLVPLLLPAAFLILLSAGLLGAALQRGDTGQAPESEGPGRAAPAADVGIPAQPGIELSAKTEAKKAGKTPEQLEADSVLAKVAERASAIRALTAGGKSIRQAPPFTTTTREDKLEYFPCSDCHEDQKPNRKVRELTEEHEDLKFEHGGGRYWCYDACHTDPRNDTLVSLRGEPIGFDEAYKLCGQCHFERQKDWYFGGHGKRAGTFEDPREVPLTHDEIDFSDREAIGRWQGERVIHICTDCHDAHSPSIKVYEASPPPAVRSGLTRVPPDEPDHTSKLWLRNNHGTGEKK